MATVDVETPGVVRVVQLEIGGVAFRVDENF